jgi:ABC-type Fe3+ transport system permease subunit
VNPAPNWEQLAYDVAHLAAMLLVLSFFLYCVGLVARRTLKDCNAFMRCGLKAEFTHVHGFLDIVMFVIFCVFVYSHAVTELFLGAVGLARESSDPGLWNSNARTFLTATCFLASVIFVGLLSYPRKDQKSKY